MKRSKTSFRRPIQFQSSSRRRPGGPVVPERSHFKLSLFGTLLRDPQSAAIKAELKWLTGELGPARELEVLMRRVIEPVQRGGIRTGRAFRCSQANLICPNKTITHHDAPGGLLQCRILAGLMTADRLGSIVRITGSRH